MRLLFLMFVTEVCVLFLLKLRWPKTKGILTLLLLQRKSLCETLHSRPSSILTSSPLFLHSLSLPQCVQQFLASPLRKSIRRLYELKTDLVTLIRNL